jgi:hypothetical protein
MSSYSYEEADRPRTLADIANTTQCSCCEREAHRMETCSTCDEPMCEECRRLCEEGDHVICKACAHPMGGGAYFLCLVHRVDELVADRVAA